MKVTIRRDNDPFKKYWWVLLVVFGIAGSWICMPALQSKGLVGGAPGAADASGGGLMTEQSLGSAQNPEGAPGGVVDLSMDGLGGRRKADGSTMTSSLYQAPEGSEEAPKDEVAANAAPAGPNYADALREVSQKKADPSGWGGVKPQKGFTAPKGAFGSLSGLGGSGSSGGTGASFSGGAFGTGKANTGFAATRGLGADAPVGDGKAAMGMLKEARKLSSLAASAKSLDAGAAMASRSFDGGRGGSAGSGIGAGGAPAGGTYGALDAAPANLKANDPNLDHFDVKAPPAAVAGDMENSEEWKKQLLMMGLSMVVGGMFGPMAGMMMQMVTMAANQRNQEGKSGSNVGGQMNRQAFNAPSPRRDYGFAIS